MLVLTRRAGEGFLIGDDIEVKITKIVGRQVHVAIRAPLSIPILRTELAARKPEAEGEADGNK